MERLERRWHLLLDVVRHCGCNILRCTAKSQVRVEIHGLLWDRSGELRRLLRLLLLLERGLAVEARIVSRGTAVNGRILMDIAINTRRAH